MPNSHMRTIYETKIVNGSLLVQEMVGVVMENGCVSIADLLPDSGADYETDYHPIVFKRNMRVTHYWCPETHQMQPLKYWLDKTINTYYNDLGGQG